MIFNGPGKFMTSLEGRKVERRSGKTRVIFPRWPSPGTGASAGRVACIPPSSTGNHFALSAKGFLAAVTSMCKKSALMIELFSVFSLNCAIMQETRPLTFSGVQLNRQISPGRTRTHPITLLYHSQFNYTKVRLRWPCAGTRAVGAILFV